MRTLPRSFYARSAVEVARGLLGKILQHGDARARIVETEAYLGTGDAAAHSARGITPRTRVLFGPPGHAYVYFIYGMHYCLNVVAEPEGVAGCVLIRAVEPLNGLAGATEGPGKLTSALGLTTRFDGTDLTRGPLRVLAPNEAPAIEVGVSSRIGIRAAVDLPLRFFIEGNPFVSRPSKPR